MSKNDMPYSLSQEELERWQNDGILVIENFFSEDQIDSVLRAIFAYFQHYAPKVVAFDCNGPPHLSDEFHAALIKLRLETPEVFSKIYNTMQTNALINGHTNSPQVLSVVGQLFDDPPETLSRSDTLFRMDPPTDSHNLVGWHQDRTSRPHNDSGLNGLVFLMPLQDTTMENGSMKVSMGSHKEGFLDSSLEDTSEEYASQIYSLPEEKLAKYEPVQLTAKVGDGIFMSFNLFHASGNNTSKRVRFTMGMRFQRAIADDFHPGTLVFSPVK